MIAKTTYKTVHAIGLVNFDAALNKLVNDGWTTAGYPLIVIHTQPTPSLNESSTAIQDDNIALYQQVMKIEQVRDKK